MRIPENDSNLSTNMATRRPSSPYLILYHFRSALALPCPALPCPALSYPILSCPVLPRPRHPRHVPVHTPHLRYPYSYPYPYSYQPLLLPLPLLLSLFLIYHTLLSRSILHVWPWNIKWPHYGVHLDSYGEKLLG